MFSNLIGHTRAFFPQANSNDHIGTDVGDFDQTPPPSSRVSVDVPRSEDMGSEAIKELRTNHDTTSLGHLKSPLTDSEVSGTNKLTPLTKTRQFEPSTETTNTLGAIPAPPYHKTSLSQDGMAIQHSPLESSLGGQDDHEVKDVPRTTGILCADKDLKSSSGEIDQRPTFEQDSPRSRSILPNKG
ncbi:major facilitator superfamily transporter [Fusarium bulbicola]|nr:major facilitator superfamily transporter [Fusarium bulbicola]